MQNNELPNIHQQSGIVLIPVVLTLTLVAILAFLINQEVTISVNMQAGETQSMQVRYAAEAGLQHALWKVQQANCNGYNNLSETLLNSFLYTAAINPNNGSPVSISSMGSHTNGASYTIQRDQVKVYQTSLSTTDFIPTSVQLDDAYIRDGANKDKSFGAETILKINNASAEEATLLRFTDFSSLPITESIKKVTLSLYLAGGRSLTNGVLNLHKVNQPWVEGNYSRQKPTSPNGGVTYKSYDLSLPWTNAGGDYDATPIDSLTLSTLTTGWYEWEITDEVLSWMSGSVNNGLLLRASGSGNVDKIFFTSAEGLAANVPKLTITYVCECGLPCSTFCNSNYIPTTHASEFLTTAYGSTSIKGITFFPEGKTFNGTISPAGGGWISVDSDDDTIKMTDLAGGLLTSTSAPQSNPTGITFISSGSFTDHLAISDYVSQGIDFVNLNSTTVSSISTSALGATNPVDVAFIGSTENGTYEDMLAVLTVDGFIYITNQSGTLQISLDLTGSTSQVEGIVHLPGKELFMVADRGLDQNLIFDFDGSLINSYPIDSFGSESAYAITVNPETCEHIIGDLGVDKVITLID